MDQASQDTFQDLDARIEDGSSVFEGRVPAEIGAMLKQALDRAMEWADAQERDGRGQYETGETGRDASAEASEANIENVD